MALGKRKLEQQELLVATTSLPLAPFPPALVTSPVSGVGNPYAFTGRRMDHIDSDQLLLYHYRAREYDPHHGRFMQRDPGGYVDGMSLYEYAKSAPMTRLDPFGAQSALHDTVAVKTKNCGKWPTPQGTLNLHDVITHAVRSACNDLRKLRDDIETSGMSHDDLQVCMHKTHILKTLSLSHVHEVIKRTYDASCRNKPRHFHCKCNTESKHCRKSSKPSMLTPPTLIGRYYGQPITVCIDNLTNAKKEITQWMKHELFRWFVGDKRDAFGQTEADRFDAGLVRIARCVREYKQRQASSQPAQ